jgi:hypothetical protein
MARASRPKSRTQLLAEAHTHAIAAQAALAEIDLRTTRGDLREAIRDGRQSSEDLIIYLGNALQEDLPAPRRSAALV